MIRMLWLTPFTLQMDVQWLNAVCVKEKLYPSTFKINISRREVDYNFLLVILVSCV